MNNQLLNQHLRYLVPQLRLALIKEPGKQGQRITGPNDLEKFVEPLRSYAEENFVTFHLDALNTIIGYHLVSHGTVSSSLVHPREVFKAALLANSHSILVAHNHPAGSLSPSKEDLDVTKILIAAGELMNVHVIDHIIVTAHELVSLRESHGYLWPMQ